SAWRSRMPKRAANLARGGKASVLTARGKLAALTGARPASSSRPSGVSRGKLDFSGNGPLKTTPGASGPAPPSRPPRPPPASRPPEHDARRFAPRAWGAEAEPHRSDRHALRAWVLAQAFEACREGPADLEGEGLILIGFHATRRSHALAPEQRHPGLVREALARLHDEHTVRARAIAVARLQDDFARLARDDAEADAVGQHIHLEARVALDRGGRRCGTPL